MGLFSKNPDRGAGSNGKCPITGYKANTTTKTIFGGQMKVSDAITTRKHKSGKR